MVTIDEEEKENEKEKQLKAVDEWMKRLEPYMEKQREFLKSEEDYRSKISLLKQYLKFLQDYLLKARKENPEYKNLNQPQSQTWTTEQQLMLGELDKKYLEKIGINQTQFKELLDFINNMPRD